MNNAETKLAFDAILKRIFLMRHGRPIQSDMSEAWQFGRDSLLTLTPDGMVEVVQAAAAFRDQRLDGVSTLYLLHSDIARAVQTQQLFNQYVRKDGLEIKVTAEPRLREFFWNESGSWPEGFSFDDYMSDPFRYKSPSGNDFGIHTVPEMMEAATELLYQEFLWAEMYMRIPGVPPNYATVCVGHHFKSNMILLSAEMVSRSLQYVPSQLENTSSNVVETAVDFVRDLFKLALKRLDEVPTEQGDLVFMMNSLGAKVLNRVMGHAAIEFSIGTLPEEVLGDIDQVLRLANSTGLLVPRAPLYRRFKRERQSD